MKKIITTVVLLTTLLFTYAQTNTFPTTGNVGIGTTNPQTKLDVKSLQNNAIAPSNGVAKFVGNDAGIFIGTLAGTPNYGSWLQSMRESDALAFQMLLNPLGGNVGIGTSTPSAKLDVNGDVKISGLVNSSSFNDQLVVVDSQGNLKKSTVIIGGGSSQINNNVVYYNSGCGTINNGIKIKTNIPYPTGGSGGDMPTINIEGFAYGKQSTIGLNINWYVYGNEFHVSSNISSYGGYAPKVILAKENGKVVIFLDDKTYCINFGVKALGRESYTNYQGWTVVDEALNPDAESTTKALEYKNAFGNVKVDGKLEAKEVKVTTTPTADFVFAENYALPKLEEVEKFVKEKKHLPEIASAKEMEKEGVNVGEFQIKLLQKIEELTLYSIEQNKKNKELESKTKSQEETLRKLLQRIELLERK